MTRLLLPRSFALGLTLVLVACSGHPEDSTDEGVAVGAVSGSGVTVDMLPANVWNNGITGMIMITDHAFTSPITSFQIVFKLGGITAVSGSGWDGIISGPDASGNITATNPDRLKFTPIQRGQIWDISFTGSGTFSGSTIVSVKINGQTIPIFGDDPARRDPARR